MTTVEKDLKDALEGFKKLRDKYVLECQEKGVNPDISLLDGSYNNTARSIRDAILTAVSKNEKTTVPEIFDRVRAMGIDSHDISIRNELSKLKTTGEIQSVGHGIYIRLDKKPSKKKKESSKCTV